MYMGGEESGVPLANVIYVNQHPIWPGAGPGRVVRSPVHPRLSWTVLQEPVLPMLLGLWQDVSSSHPKPTMHVRRQHESKHLSKLWRPFLIKKSEVWQGSPQAR